MSWSSHINTILCRSRKLLGLIYRQFYNTCSPNTILSLNTTIVHPVLEYGSIIWDPKSTSLISSLEIECISHSKKLPNPGLLLTNHSLVNFTSKLSIYDVLNLNEFKFLNFTTIFLIHSTTRL